MNKLPVGLEHSALLTVASGETAGEWGGSRTQCEQLNDFYPENVRKGPLQDNDSV